MALPYTSILAGASGQSSGYSISNSARFVSGNSAYLTRTPGAASNRTTYTLSAWVKRGALSVSQMLFQAGTASQFYVQLTATDKISINSIDGAGLAALLTTQVFRDVGAWYHIVIAVDTNNATAANRVRLYVNGSEVTAFDTRNNPGLGATGNWNNNVVHNFGRLNGGSDYADCYVANVTHIDGSQLTPSSFGQTNTSGVWVPKAYTGTYGTNGFLMAFLNSAGLGSDTSGNGNTFTVSGLVAGDQMTDTPTLNYPTMNPLVKLSASWTMTAGNLTTSVTTAGNSVGGSWGYPAGKWYSEHKLIGNPASSYAALGFWSTTAAQPLASWPGNGAVSGGLLIETASSRAFLSTTYPTVSTTTSLGFATNDIVNIAYNATTREVWFGKNGTWQGDPSAGTGACFTLPSGYTYMFCHGDYGASGTNTVNHNFGQYAFGYSPPTGYVALNSTNLPAPAIKDGSAHFQTALHTGTGSAITINQSGNSTFTPDFVWTKGRSGATNHVLSNIISGTGKYLSSNATTAETTDAQALTAFGAGSISYGTLAAANTSAATYVDWMWKGGGAGVSNTSGSITSTVSVNTTAGISIVTYTGTGANATVGHGLGVAAQMVIVKKVGAVGAWIVWHTGIPATDQMDLNSTAATGANATCFNSTIPTSTVFSVGTNAATNGLSATYVAYVFAPISSFSAFNSYTGNASADGAFVYLGFRPAFVLIKSSSAVDNWRIYDSSRPGYNVQGGVLLPNTTGAETTTAEVDLLSNGFKCRIATTPNAANTMIYAAFASNPFGGSGAAPATAR